MTSVNFNAKHENINKIIINSQESRVKSVAIAILTVGMLAVTTYVGLFYSSTYFSVYIPAALWIYVLARRTSHIRISELSNNSSSVQAATLSQTESPTRSLAIPNALLAENSLMRGETDSLRTQLDSAPTVNSSTTSNVLSTMPVSSEKELTVEHVPSSSTSLVNPPIKVQTEIPVNALLTSPEGASLVSPSTIVPNVPSVSLEGEPTVEHVPTLPTSFVNPPIKVQTEIPVNALSIPPEGASLVSPSTIVPDMPPASSKGAPTVEHVPSSTLSVSNPILEPVINGTAFLQPRRPSVTSIPTSVLEPAVNGATHLQQRRSSITSVSHSIPEPVANRLALLQPRRPSITSIPNSINSDKHTKVTVRIDKTKTAIQVACNLNAQDPMKEVKEKILSELQKMMSNIDLTIDQLELQFFRGQGKNMRRVMLASNSANIFTSSKTHVILPDAILSMLS